MSSLKAEGRAQAKTKRHLLQQKRSIRLCKYGYPIKTVRVYSTTHDEYTFVGVIQ